MPFTNNILAGNGTIDYAQMLHLSNAFAFNQFAIGKLINLPWFINYPVNNGSGSPYDPDASAWFSAVEATGSTITSTNKTAFNTAFLSLKSNNIWGSITQGCFFVGIDGANPLAGAFTPFKTPAGVVPINQNFTTGDYNRLTGIVVNGGNDITSTKSINTNVSNSIDPYTENPDFPYQNRHFLGFNTRNDLSTGIDVGSFYATGRSQFQSFDFLLNGTTGQNAFWNINNNASGESFYSNSLTITSGGRGFFGAQYVFTDTYSNSAFFESNYLKFNGSEYSFDDASPYETESTSLEIAATPAGGIKRIAYYSLGFGLPDPNNNNGLTSVQAYDTIINTLLSSLA